jgi:6-pyruvoyltetrahydropterin/6-carboxytetrahydropterin synthase
LIRLHLSSELDEVMGWTIDYGDVKSAFLPIYQQLDHWALHEIATLPDPGIPSVLRWVKSRASSILPQRDRIDLFDKPSRGATLCWGKSRRAFSM